jgi:hypothetical protein
MPGGAAGIGRYTTLSATAESTAGVPVAIDTSNDVLLSGDGDPFGIGPSLDTEKITRIVGKGGEAPQVIDKIYTVQGGMPIFLPEKSIPKVLQWAFTRTAAGDCESRTLNHNPNLGTNPIQYAGSKVRSVTIAASIDSPALRVSLDIQSIDHKLAAGSYTSGQLDALRSGKDFTFAHAFVVLPNVRSVNPSDWGSIACIEVTGFSLQVTNGVSAIGKQRKITSGDEGIPRKWRNLPGALLGGGQAVTGTLTIVPTDLSQFNFVQTRTQAMLFLYFIDPTVNGKAMSAASVQASGATNAKLKFSSDPGYAVGDVLLLAKTAQLATPPEQVEAVKVAALWDDPSDSLEVVGRAGVSSSSNPYGLLKGTSYASGDFAFGGAFEIFIPGLTANAHGFKGGATEGVTEELTIEGDQFVDHLGKSYNAIHWAAKGSYV